MRLTSVDRHGRLLLSDLRMPSGSFDGTCDGASGHVPSASGHVPSASGHVSSGARASVLMQHECSTVNDSSSDGPCVSVAVRHAASNVLATGGYGVIRLFDQTQVDKCVATSSSARTSLPVLQEIKFLDSFTFLSRRIGDVSALAFHPERSLLAFGSSDGHVGVHASLQHRPDDVRF
ncbi:MAG: hypothetical protein MHM6MM_008063 [Cercozoa sp. M6MM]